MTTGKLGVIWSSMIDDVRIGKASVHDRCIDRSSDLSDDQIIDDLSDDQIIDGQITNVVAWGPASVRYANYGGQARSSKRVASPGCRSPMGEGGSGAEVGRPRRCQRTETTEYPANGSSNLARTARIQRTPSRRSGRCMSTETLRFPVAGSL